MYFILFYFILFPSSFYFIAKLTIVYFCPGAGFQASIIATQWQWFESWCWWQAGSSGSCQEKTPVCGTLNEITSRLHAPWCTVPGNDQTLFLQHLNAALSEFNYSRLRWHHGKMPLMVFCGRLQQMSPLHPIMTALRCVSTCCFCTLRAKGGVEQQAFGFLIISVRSWEAKQNKL